MALRHLAALLTIATVAHAERAASTTLPAHTVQLGNGLTVVLAPDPTMSSVVVHIRYRDGSAGEGSTQAGFTNLVDHLMFAGSVHVKAGEYDARIDAAGGFTGSVSGADHLSVFEQVPAGALELAMFLEAERMAGLADGITETGLTAAREAVAAEIRAAYVDQPSALVEREVQRALWPEGHRYRLDVLGDGHVVPTAALDAVRAFARARIRPGNATLVIAGNLDVGATTTLARRYFGWIPDHRDAAAAATPVEPLAAPVRVEIVDVIPKVIVAFRLPAPRDPDFVVAEVAARLIESRLRVLVDDGRATAIQARVVRHRDAGELHLSVTPGHATPAQLADATLRELSRVRDVLTHELEGAVTAFETDLLMALEGLIYRTDALARWHEDASADYLGGLPSRLRALTPLVVRTLIARWLGPSAHVVVIASEHP